MTIPADPKCHDLCDGIEHFAYDPSVNAYDPVGYCPRAVAADPEGRSAGAS